MERFGRNRGSIRSRLKKLAEDRLQELQILSKHDERNHPSYDYPDEDPMPFLRETLF